MHDDFQLQVRVRFEPPGERGHRYYGVPLSWASTTLVAFNEVLFHCAAVAYSDEHASEGALIFPDPSELPRATVRSGSLVIEVLTSEPTLWGANALGLFAVLLKKGPELAGLPHRIRERWYTDAAAAERAKQALEELRRSLPDELTLDSRLDELSRRYGEFSHPDGSDDEPDSPSLELPS